MQRFTAQGPLAGFTVVDLTTTFMGPYCTLQLAQLGAEVVKVEAPSGDVVRYVGDRRGTGMGPIFLNANQGKRSLALDLHKPGGRDVLLRLVAASDVFVHNLRPGAVRRLGIGYEAVSEANPRCIYCALRGFGAAGPYRDKAAYDDVIQAICGLASVQGGSGDPEYVRSPISDKVVGVMASGAITAALLQRERTGAGQQIEVPMFESMVAFTLLEQQGGYLFDPPDGDAGYARTASPYRKPYRTADGHIGVVVYTDAQWRSFFDIVGLPELATDPRYRTVRERTEHIDQLYQLVEKELVTRTTAEWLELLDAAGIPATPVRSVPELFSDEHLEAVELFERVQHPSEGALRPARFPISFSATPAGPTRAAARLGEHGIDVLAELGYEQAEIQQLLADGVVAAERGRRPG